MSAGEEVPVVSAPGFVAHEHTLGCGAALLLSPQRRAAAAAFTA